METTTKKEEQLRTRLAKLRMDLGTSAMIEEISQALPRCEKGIASGEIAATKARDYLAKLGCVYLPL